MPGRLLLPSRLAAPALRAGRPAARRGSRGVAQTAAMSAADEVGVEPGDKVAWNWGGSHVEGTVRPGFFVCTCVEGLHLR